MKRLDGSDFFRDCSDDPRYFTVTSTSNTGWCAGRASPRRAKAAADKARVRGTRKDLPVSPAWPDDRPAEAGLGRPTHLPSDRGRVPLSRGGHRLGEPGG